MGEKSLGKERLCTELRILGRGLLAQTLAIELNNKLYAPLHDQNGNIAALIDADSGKLQETYSIQLLENCSLFPLKTLGW